MPPAAISALDLARDLIRCPSVTPADAGALDVLQAALGDLGFTCHRLTFSELGTPDVDNLYARFGRAAPNFCFAGHTDVVPVGEAQAWSIEPFAAEIRDGHIHGRGACDMKCALAAFTTAAAGFLADRPEGFQGSISLLVTGDEEGPAINGTVKVLQWLAARGETLDACVVGEPTNPTRLGEMIKIGRRGSIGGTLTVTGTQGHVAYPDLADNPIPRLMATLGALDRRVLDTGNAHFPASNLEITTVDVGNPATNVIPARASASFNIRFNTEHAPDALVDWIRAVAAEHAGRHELEVAVNSGPFLTPPGKLSEIVAAAIEAELGQRPVFSTTGGTSDARFIKEYCPVVEFGLVGQTMHKVDERCRIEDLEHLTQVYRAVLEGYFNA